MAFLEAMAKMKIALYSECGSPVPVQLLAGDSSLFHIRGFSGVANDIYWNAEIGLAICRKQDSSYA